MQETGVLKKDHHMKKEIIKKKYFFLDFLDEFAWLHSA